MKLFFDVSSPDVKDITSLKELCEYAESKHLKLMIHSSNSTISMEKLVNQLRAGDIWTHAYHGGRNNSSEHHFECIRLAKSRNIIVDTGFAGHVHTDFEILKHGTEFKKGFRLMKSLSRAVPFWRKPMFGIEPKLPENVLTPLHPELSFTRKNVSKPTEQPKQIFSVNDALRRILQILRNFYPPIKQD